MSPADEPTCLIRRADFNDATALMAMYRAFLEETAERAPNVCINPQLDVHSAVVKLLRRKASAVLIAVSQDEAAGFAFVEFRPGTAAGGWMRRTAQAVMGTRQLVPLFREACAWLAHLYVEPPWRRKGIATALVAAAGDWGRARGARTLELNVLASNLPARRLYERMGMDELLVQYRKTLDSPPKA